MHPRCPTHPGSALVADCCRSRPRWRGREPFRLPTAQAVVFRRKQGESMKVGQPIKVLAVVIAALALSATALAGSGRAPTGTSVNYIGPFCVNKSNGLVRAVASKQKCRKAEKRTMLPVKNLRRGLSQVPGPAGQAGTAGVNGKDGAAGAVGAVGPAGPIGLIGPVGSQGEPGPIGLMGPIGPQGDRKSVVEGKSDDWGRWRH